MKSTWTCWLPGGGSCRSGRSEMGQAKSKQIFIDTKCSIILVSIPKFIDTKMVQNAQEILRTLYEALNYKGYKQTTT